MNKPNPKLFLGYPAEVRRYIAGLERANAERDEQVKTIHTSMVRPRLPFIEVHPEHKEYIEQLERELALARGDYLQMADKLNALGAEYNKLTHAERDKQREQLDQFAMAALPSLVSQRHLSCFECAAAAYNYAEAMQAESQKRQGGEV